MSVHRLSLVDGVVKLAILYIYMSRIGYDSATANIFFSQSSSSLFVLNFKKPSRDKIINKLAWREQVRVFFPVSRKCLSVRILHDQLIITFLSQCFFLSLKFLAIALEIREKE